MSIGWNAFTPWSSLVGGVLISVAAAMFMLLNGRIAGVIRSAFQSLDPQRIEQVLLALRLRTAEAGPEEHRRDASRRHDTGQASGIPHALAGAASVVELVASRLPAAWAQELG